jgi:uncharacterized protein (DUF433 family)
MPSQTRVVVDPRILAGKPVIRGTRVPVHLILGLLGAGMTREAVLAEYPQLAPEDLDAAAAYAAQVLESTEWAEFGVV